MDDSLCLFCEKPRGNPKEAHVIPRCVGGSLTTRKTTCTSCNKHYGDELEPELVKRYLPIRQTLAHLSKGKLKNLRELVTKASGEKLVLLPGGEPSLPKPEVQAHHPNGRPKQVLAPRDERSREKAHVILGGDRSSHRMTYEQVSEDDDYVIHCSLYDTVYPQLAANMLLEYMGDQQQIGFPSVWASEYRAVARFSRFGASKATELIPLVDVHAYPHRIHLVRKLAQDWGLPESNFAHRLIIVCNPAERLVWGLVSLYDSDVWAVRLATGYDGPPLTHIYQRTFLTGEHDDARTKAEVSLNHERDFLDHQLDPLSGPTTIGSLVIAAPVMFVSDASQRRVRPHPLSDTPMGATGNRLASRLHKLYHRAISHAELTEPVTLVRDVLWQLGAPRRVNIEDVLSALEERLRRFFQHHEGWSEWPSIKRDYTDRHAGDGPWENPGVGFDDPDEGTELARAVRDAYAELFRRCESHIGIPGRLYDRGIIGGVREADVTDSRA